MRRARLIGQTARHFLANENRRGRILTSNQFAIHYHVSLPLLRRRAQVSSRQLQCRLRLKLHCAVLKRVSPARVFGITATAHATSNALALLLSFGLAFRASAA